MCLNTSLNTFLFQGLHEVLIINNHGSFALTFFVHTGGRKYTPNNLGEMSLIYIVTPYIMKGTVGIAPFFMFVTHNIA